MIVREDTRKVTVEDLVTVEYLDDLSTGIDFESSSKDISILKGNKRELKQKVSNLLVVFIQAIVP